MRVKINTLPLVEPVSLFEAKDHLRIDEDIDNEDVYISELISVARSAVESYTGRALITQTWEMYLDMFPSSNFILLPFGQLQSVESIVITNSDGEETTLTVTEKDPVDTETDEDETDEDETDEDVTDGEETTLTVTDQYLVDTDSEPGRIILPYSESWPSFQHYPVNPIKIVFVCGYGDTGLSVPYMLKAAIKLIVSDLYENRESQSYGNMNYVVNKTAANLIMQYKLWNIF